MESFALNTYPFSFIQLSWPAENRLPQSVARWSTTSTRMFSPLKETACSIYEGNTTFIQAVNGTPLISY